MAHPPKFRASKSELEGLARKLIKGEEVTLYKERFNDGTEEEPDAMINHVYAYIEENHGNRDIVVSLSKEYDDAIGDQYEFYRMPFITDVNTLKVILEESERQGHID